MKIELQLGALDAANRLKEIHPMPWYLEQSNDRGVCVKDCRGETVYAEYFEERGRDDFTDAHPTYEALRAQAFASFLVRISEVL